MPWILIGIALLIYLARHNIEELLGQYEQFNLADMRIPGLGVFAHDIQEFSEKNVVMSPQSNPPGVMISVSFNDPQGLLPGILAILGTLALRLLGITATHRYGVYTFSQFQKISPDKALLYGNYKAGGNELLKFTQEGTFLVIKLPPIFIKKQSGI